MYPQLPPISRRLGRQALLACGGLVLLLLVIRWTNNPTNVFSSVFESASWWVNGSSSMKSAWGTELDPAFYVNGPPTASFRDNLKPNFRYLTTWNYAGMTNELQSACNLIYLGIISRRIPILNPLLPIEHHVGQGAVASNLGEFFDLPRLAKAIQTPVLQWSDVKIAPYGVAFEDEMEFWRTNDVEDDYLGCWTNYAAFIPSHGPASGGMPEFLRMMATYTRVPPWVKLDKKDKGDFHVSLPGLAGLLFPEGRERALHAPSSREILMVDDIPTNLTSWPDEQLGCFDNMYFAGVKETWEWEKDSPVWDLVGTHLHFTDRIKSLAETYLRETFGLRDTDPIPPVITVHIRRNDFLDQCNRAKAAECFAPLSAYAKRVQEARQDLMGPAPGDLMHENVTHVLITSDEKNPAWWDEVRNMGWYRVDHERMQTVSKYGSWYPTVIDSAILSMGSGFVGTKGSTMTDIVARRVKNWQRGPTRIVRWGKPGADDH